MQFDWDIANTAHIARHSVTPEEAEQVLENNPIDAGAALRSGETRTLHLGETDAARILFVVVTERKKLYRVVTARPADRNERAIYLRHKVANDQDPTDS